MNEWYVVCIHLPTYLPEGGRDFLMVQGICGFGFGFGRVEFGFNPPLFADVLYYLH